MEAQPTAAAAHRRLVEKRDDNGMKIAYDIQIFLGGEEKDNRVCVCVVGVVWVLCVLLVLCVVS